VVFPVVSHGIPTENFRCRSLVQTENFIKSVHNFFELRVFTDSQTDRSKNITFSGGNEIVVYVSGT